MNARTVLGSVRFPPCRIRHSSHNGPSNTSSGHGAVLRHTVLLHFLSKTSRRRHLQRHAPAPLPSPSPSPSPTLSPSPCRRVWCCGTYLRYGPRCSSQLLRADDLRRRVPGLIPRLFVHYAPAGRPSLGVLRRAQEHCSSRTPLIPMSQTARRNARPEQTRRE